MVENEKDLQETKNQNEEQINSSNKFIIKLLVGFFAIFLGTFLAVFAVFSSVIRNSHVAYAFDNHVSSQINDDFFKNADKEFDRLFKESQMFPVIRFNNNLLKPENATLRTEETPKEYKIIVNLKSFGNDEKNVDFKADKNRFTINAKYKNDKDKNSFSSTSFYESFGLPGKINDSKITKERKGDKLVITIPKNTEQN
jgi:HSP20 family molecular chaperone IbpA